MSALRVVCANLFCCYLTLLLLQMGLNPYRRRRDNPFDRNQAKQQRYEGDAGPASKVLRLEKGEESVGCRQQRSSSRRCRLHVGKVGNVKVEKRTGM